MRLFIGILLSEEMQGTLIETLHALKKKGVSGSYATASNLHLTLAFIGEADSASAVKAAMQTVRCKPFRLSLTELTAFGDVLCVGAKGSQGLFAAEREIKTALDQAGIAYDKKKFVPHITLVRRMAGDWRQIQAPRQAMMVKRISLLKSEEKNGRRVYTEIFSI